jgi:iron(III) transport system ATP-binding protein
MLSVQNVSITYDRSVLESVNLELNKGEALAIVGKSGVGKSSLLRIIAGQLDPTEGSVYWQGNRIKGPSEQLIPGHPCIELVSQDFKLEAFTSVEENVRSAVLHYDHSKRDRTVKKMITLFELNEVARTKVELLSGGEQQRVALARALAREPRLLLLDEPFSHLDAVLRSKLSRYLKIRQRNSGMTVVLVSHDGAEVLSFADRIMHLHKGKVMRLSCAEKMYFRPKSLGEARLLGTINSIKIGKERYVFRPNEFWLSDETNANENTIILKVEFQDYLFLGTHYENYFSTEKKETIQLIHKEIMHDVDQIHIKKKS